MMELRPIIVDNDGLILGGNMRFKALQELKYKDIPDLWVKRAEALTEDEKKRFIIEDNVPQLYFFSREFPQVPVLVMEGK